MGVLQCACTRTVLCALQNNTLLGQSTLEAILQSHLGKYGCLVDLGTGLRTIANVLAKVVKRTDNEEVIETFEASYLVGADGAKGVLPL